MSTRNAPFSPLQRANRPPGRNAGRLRPVGNRPARDIPPSRSVFENLAPATGSGAVLSVATLLDRLDALENSPDRKSTRKADHAALERLAQRGITSDERARLRQLVKVASAPAPEGPWSNDIVAVGWTSTSPFSEAGAAFKLGDAPELKDCVIATEPGAALVPGVGLDLALGCVSLPQGQPAIRVVLLRSTDHGATFSYVSTLLTPGDAQCLDASATRINAPDLFFAGGKEYLLGTPESATSGYHGCFVFPIDDPAKGALRRNNAGEPVFLRRIDVSTGQFAGACTYAEGATALGVAMPVGFLNDTRRFRIFSTGIELP